MNRSTTTTTTICCAIGGEHTVRYGDLASVCVDCCTVAGGAR
jgi:hypothetical protein